MVAKIIEHMIKTGEWGKFFPSTSSPFAYNESVANEYVPLSKEAALAQGYKWKDKNPKEYSKQTYIVPAEIKDVKDDILDATLACGACGKNYKVIAQELAYYRKMNLPVATKCFDCRYSERMKIRNACKIYDRKCMKCNVDLKSTFAPQDKRTVYCEKCYYQTVQGNVQDSEDFGNKVGNLT